MNNTCPFCGSPLSAARYAEVMKKHRGLQRELEKLQKAQRRAEGKVAEARRRIREIQVRAKEKAKRAREEERRRAEDRLRKYQTTVDNLRKKCAELEDRIRRGETAQSEGLLEEKALLAFLRQHFPTDRFEHVGKGGDIIHDVCAPRGQRAGRIVYEVKREADWKNKNLLQAAEAKTKREANIAVLVTNRFPAKRQYYFVERDILVVSPQGILPLVHTAREGFLTIHALNVSGEQKKAAARAVYEYLAGGAYTSHIKKVAQHFQDLELLFHKEVKTHKAIWGSRLDHYRGILSGVGSVHEKLRGVIAPLSTNEAKIESADALLPAFNEPQVLQRISAKR